MKRKVPEASDELQSIQHHRNLLHSLARSLAVRYALWIFHSSICFRSKSASLCTLYTLTLTPIFSRNVILCNICAVDFFLSPGIAQWMERWIRASNETGDGRKGSQLRDRFKCCSENNSLTKNTISTYWYDNNSCRLNNNRAQQFLSLA